MSRGLGLVQRAMLIALARLHIADAEKAVREQARRHRYDPHRYVSTDAILRNAVAHELAGDRRSQTEEEWRTAWYAEIDRKAAEGDKSAIFCQAALKTCGRIMNITHDCRR